MAAASYETLAAARGGSYSYLREKDVGALDKIGLVVMAQHG
jgi:hypothetical protein